MNSPDRFKRAGLLAALLLPILVAAQPPPPEKVTGPASCAECHVQEIETWKLSRHFKTLNEMNRRPEAAEILRKLGLKSMKTEGRCADCHYLSGVVDREVQIVSGLACESCHGAARDWIQVHADFGGKGVAREAESSEHRDARLARSRAAGMIGPENIYALGASCYGCHVLDDEKLANVGGHSAGSAGFELLAWSQGEVRHNLLHTGNKSNPEAPLEQRRRLFVVGWILETEFSLRAVARATEKAAYGVTFARRADAARKMLEKIQSLAPSDELAGIVAVAQPLALRLNNRAELEAAAGRISVLGREFAAKVGGDRLAALDPLLPGAAQYKGRPYEVAGPAAQP